MCLPASGLPANSRAKGLFSTGWPIIGPTTPLDRYLTKVQAAWLRTRM
jgi:hypothetical protein